MVSTPFDSDSAPSASTIALLTDFGSADHYVGAVKGVIVSVYSRCRIVDLSNDVDSGNIAQAAYLLWASYRFFPHNTVFVCVVDPGVGSSRKILAARTKKFFFLAPDNGLLDLVMAEDMFQECVAVRIENSPFVLSPVSATFHGRDVFAPVAGYVSSGVALSEIGSPVHIPMPKSPFVSQRGVRKGSILHCDKFGNCVTNIKNGLFPSLKGIMIGRTMIAAKINHFQEGKKNVPAVIRGSSGLVEIILKGESASRKLRARPGVALRLGWK